jgi:hypothetical protein
MDDLRGVCPLQETDGKRQRLDRRKVIIAENAKDLDSTFTDYPGMRLG